MNRAHVGASTSVPHHVFVPPPPSAGMMSGSSAATASGSGGGSAASRSSAAAAAAASSPHLSTIQFPPGIKLEHQGIKIDGKFVVVVFMPNFGR